MTVYRLKTFNMDKIPKNTTFVLDTNILYYIHSGYYMEDVKHAKYANLVQSLIINKYKVAVSVISIQELLFGIENKEYQLYCIEHNLKREVYTKKAFRKNKKQRNILQQKLMVILSELSIYDIDNGIITNNMLRDYINMYNSHKMDPIDFLLVNNYDVGNVIFVSDDKDFTSLPSLHILKL